MVFKDIDNPNYYFNENGLWEVELNRYYTAGIISNCRKIFWISRNIKWCKKKQFYINSQKNNRWYY